MFFLSRSRNLPVSISFSPIIFVIFESLFCCNSDIFFSKSCFTCSSFAVISSLSVFSCCMFLLLCIFMFSISILSRFSISELSFWNFSFICCFVLLIFASYCSFDFNVSFRSLSSWICSFLFCASSFSFSPAKWVFLLSESFSNSVIFISYFFTISLFLSSNCSFSLSKFASISFFSLTDFSFKEVFTSNSFAL